MGDKIEAEEKRREPSHRKPYRTPTLQRLGTLTEITADVGFDGMTDHAGPHEERKTS